MADNELVREAVAELYTCDPAEFTRRRADLAASARAAGDAPAAKEISRLRKPTRSAWAVNRLVRADPGVPSRLAALGAELRSAGSSLAGPKIRELSRERRELIGALTRQALSMSGQRSAPAALQEEVTATLSAALADPQVAAELAAGALLRPVERAGFGFVPDAAIPDAAIPDAAVPARPARAAPAGGTARAKKAEKAGAGQDRAEAEQDRAEAERDRAEAERDRAEAERARAEEERARARAERERRRQAIAAAEQALADAEQATEDAEAAERERAAVLRQAERHVAEARKRLAEAELRAREARTAQRNARRALGRLRG